MEFRHMLFRSEKERCKWPNFQTNCFCLNGLLKSIARISKNRASHHHPSTRHTRPRRHDRNPDLYKGGSTLGASVDVLCRNGRMVCVKEDGLPLSFETHQACHPTPGQAE